MSEVHLTKRQRLHQQAMAARDEIYAEIDKIMLCESEIWLRWLWFLERNWNCLLIPTRAALKTELWVYGWSESSAEGRACALLNAFPLGSGALENTRISEANNWHTFLNGEVLMFGFCHSFAFASRSNIQFTFRTRQSASIRAEAKLYSCTTDKVFVHDDKRLLRNWHLQSFAGGCFRDSENDQWQVQDVQTTFARILRAVSDEIAALLSSTLIPDVIDCILGFVFAAPLVRFPVEQYFLFFR